jgi:inner membrane protein
MCAAPGDPKPHVEARMASALTHAYVGAALGAFAPRWLRGARFSLLLAALAAAPDLDVVAFAFGIPYEHRYGHRGFSHSLVAACLGALAVWIWRYRSVRPLSGRWFAFCAWVSIAIASHGLLDALTNGGRGVGFFIPFDERRYFFPWRPLQVSSLNPLDFLTGHALDVLVPELLWVWLPASALFVLAFARARRAASRR